MCARDLYRTGTVGADLAPELAARVESLLRLADSVLVLGHRLSEWCGRGPVLEEDIALTNVALDLTGQARWLLSHTGAVESRGRSEDDLAYLRDGRDYRNLLLVEQPNGDFAVTMARQTFFDAWHVALLERLQRSSDARLADIAARSANEAAYHLRHSSAWVVRLGDGTDESRRRMQAAVDALWRFTGELFEDDAVGEAAAASRHMPLWSELRPPWNRTIDRVFADAGLTRPVSSWMQTGGVRGEHTEHLGYLLAEMQFMQRAYHGATW